MTAVVVACFFVFTYFVNDWCDRIAEADRRAKAQLDAAIAELEALNTEMARALAERRQP